MNRSVTYFILLAAAVIGLLVVDMLFGAVRLGTGEIWNALTGAGDETVSHIFFRFRLPKAVVAVMAGAGLSACGLQMQTLFRNPLADPFILGVSSGASLGASLFVLGLPMLALGAGGEIIRNLGMAGAAWVGTAVILAVMIAVAARVREIMTILILGMMFGSATSAVVQLLQYLSPEGLLKSYVIWTMGSLGGVSTSQLAIMAPVVAIGLGISIALIKPLNILLLGENYARTMGLNIGRTRRLIFLSATLLAGTITAFCGPIGFIGIAVPHVARMLFRNADHRTLMPATMLLGAAAMLLCDIVSQLPGTDITLPINTITALLGIPVIVVVIMRKRSFF